MQQQKGTTDQVPPTPLKVFQNLSRAELKLKIQQLYSFYEAAPIVMVKGQIFDDESGIEITSPGLVVGTWGTRLRLKVNDNIRLVNVGTGTHEYIFYPPDNK